MPYTDEETKANEQKNAPLTEREEIEQGQRFLMFLVLVAIIVICLILSPFLKYFF